MELRRAEEARIKCGKEHFKAIKVGERPARYEVATSVDDLLKSLPD